MTKSESEENSKIINEYYTQALIELELGCPMDDMYDSMMYYEEKEAVFNLCRYKEGFR